MAGRPVRFESGTSDQHIMTSSLDYPRSVVSELSLYILAVLVLSMCRGCFELTGTFPLLHNRYVLDKYWTARFL